MVPRVSATVDLAAIRHNLRRVRETAPRARVMAAVKADAYGHGAVQVAHALSDADALAVACLEEAVSLREAGLRQPLVLLEGVLSAGEAREAARIGATMVVHDAQQLAWLAQAGGGEPMPAWIKLDTGMHRLGFPAAQAASVGQRLGALPGVELLGFMSHLACADEPDSTMTHRQIARFNEAVRGLPGQRSLANSAGILAWPQAHLDWVRPGLMLYGASPFADRTAADLGLRPAMRLESRLLSVHEVRAGETVGYGASWQAPRDTRVGIVAVGYADGLHRALAGSGVAFRVHGAPAALVGRVSMDMIAVDLSQVPAARVGDPVLLWGEEPRIEAVAACAGTVAYELMCGLTRRVKFVYRDEAEARPGG